MRADEMRTGQEYEMQRGGTYRKHRVTLLAKDVPSGRSRYVLVRIEDGIGAGKEKEVPSQSIQHLPGAEPPKSRRKRRGSPEEPPQTPLGWVPRRDEAVRWMRTMTRFVVLATDESRKMAEVEGELMSRMQTFDAPFAELVPFNQELGVVREVGLKERLEGCLPALHRAQASDLSPRPSPKPVDKEDEQIVDRLIFSPSCIGFYRLKFARRSNLQTAEEMMRRELESAEKIRKWHGEYLRLRVPDRFEVVLRKRPDAEDPDSHYVTGIHLVTAQNRKKKSSRRKAA